MHEIKVLKNFLNELERIYLSPAGWNCSSEMAQVVLSIFHGIKQLEKEAEKSEKKDGRPKQR